MKKNLITLLLCLVGVYCQAATPKLYEKLGGKNLAILENAKYVTILGMVPEAKYTAQHEVHLNAEEVARLKRNLLDDHNYDFDKQKKCEFHPEISLKFIDENDQFIHVFVSPICNQLLIDTGSRMVMLNYDPSHQRLEHFLQEIVFDTIKRNQPGRRA